MNLKKEYPNINEHIVAELDELFVGIHAFGKSSPPGRLRKSIQTLLFQYLRGVYNLEDDLHQTMTDVQYLVEFLDSADE